MMLILIMKLILSKTQNYICLLSHYQQKLSKLFSKGFERSVYWNEYKKVRIKIQQMSIDIFFNQIL